LFSLCPLLVFVGVSLLAVPFNTAAQAVTDDTAAQTVTGDRIHVWEMQEIRLEATNEYDNFYTDVTCWVELKGPEFQRRVFGFWAGENQCVVRIVATRPGRWTWTSGSNHPDDGGLSGVTGGFDAVAWEASALEANPNRHGFVRATPNGHALQYADGTPFFMLGDTWLAGTTWRLPFRGSDPPPNYTPGPGIGFEDAVLWRKRQGFNSVSMIASFPNWETDTNASTYADENGIYVRNAWEKFGYRTETGELTAKNMRDESGNLPFLMSEHARRIRQPSLPYVG
jgi:hypothetical protein